MHVAGIVWDVCCWARHRMPSPCRRPRTAVAGRFGADRRGRKRVGELPARANKSDAGRLQAAGNGRRRDRLPAGSTLTGQPLSLLNVLASTPDRRQQLEMTRAYWRLAQAVADVSLLPGSCRAAGRIKPAGDEPASLRLARASATAMLQPGGVGGDPCPMRIGRD